METWVAITLAAAFVQNLRSLLQRRLKSVLSNTGATFVRFGFGLPVGLTLLGSICLARGDTPPAPDGDFLAWVLLAALCQIAAQALLLHAFSFRNFVVATAYSRTEPAQAALFGVVLLGEKAGLGTLVAIAISLAGVLLLSIARSAAGLGSLVASLKTPGALYGLASGAVFGVTAVAYRAASLALPEGDYIMRGATTLVFALVIQSVSMVAWMLWREREQFAAMAKVWKTAALTGLVGAFASFGWFTAMTLQQAAVVKAVAQVEMLFALATSVLVFREHVNWREIAGAGLIVAGILGLLYVG